MLPPRAKYMVKANLTPLLVTNSSVDDVEFDDGGESDDGGDSVGGGESGGGKGDVVATL